MMPKIATEPRPLADQAELQQQISAWAQAVPGFLYTIRVNPEGKSRFPFASDGIEALLGLKAEDIRENTAALEARFHPDDLPGLFQRVHEALLTLAPFHYEYRVFHPTLGMRWIENRATSSRLPDGGLEAHGLMIDVTDRKNAELAESARLAEIVELNNLLEADARNLEEQATELEAARDHLQATKAWYRGIIHSAPDGMMVVNERGTIVLVNAELCRIYGYAESELLGQPLGKLIPSDACGLSATEYMDSLRAACADNQVFRVADVQVAKKAGGEFVAALSISKLPSTDFTEATYCFAISDVTERKRMEEESQDREAFLASLLDAIPIPVFCKDMQGRFLTINQAYERFMGVGKDALRGKTISDLGFVPRELAETYRSSDEALFASGEVQTYEAAVVTARGETRDAGFTKAAFTDGQGHPAGLIGAFIDITEQNQANRRVKQALDFAESIIAAIPDILFELDRNGTYLNVWTRDPDSLATEQEYLIGKTVRDILDPLVAETTMHALQEADEKGSSYGTTVPIQRIDGQIRYFELSLSKKAAADPKNDTFIVLSRDVTARIEVEAMLAQREQEFRSLAENLPLPVYRYDAQCRRTYVNPFVERLCGQKLSTILGATPAEVSTLGSNSDANRIMDCVRRVFETGAPEDYEIRFVAADGAEHWYRMINVPEFGADNHVHSVVAIGHDRTEQHQLEVELQRRNALEKQISSLAQAVPGCLFLCRKEPEAQLRLPFVSEGATALFGLEPQDIRHDPAILGGRLHPADRYRIIECMMESARALAPFVLEVRTCDPVKGENWIEIRATPLHQPDGAIEWHGMMFDISKRKRLEAALTQREQEFRTLLEHTPDTVARLDSDCRRQYVNPAVCRALGCSPAELLGTRPAEIPGGPSGALVEASVGKVFATAKPVEFDYLLTSKDGRELCQLVSMTPEFDANGKVCSVLSVGRDITELNASRQKIHQMAFYDPLTGLPNRALLNDRLHQMITDTSWHDQMAAIMMIDMDQFKAVNDTLGHAAGDELLREAANRLLGSVRSYDTVARLGGDEFAILLPDIRAGADIGRVASKILVAFESPFQLDGKEIFVTCSIGIAIYPDDAADAQDLMKYADSAMYHAKRSGRDAFRFYSKDMTAKAQERLSLESELRHAIARRQLELHYQPKIALPSGSVIGSEALLRWRHAQRGMIRPDQFIQIAEDTGLIVDIGNWVLHEACRTAAEWNANGLAAHKVAINLSARQFQSGNLMTSVATALSEAGCRPEWIELEITESLLLDEDGEVLTTLRAFREMGISIAIDDFGTGYSALSYLARFPIDVLKIDRSFIQTLTTDAYRAELVRAILSIARCLRQQVVAEGVETIEQAEFLNAHGCQIVQGFLYSRPVPKQEFPLHRCFHADMPN